MARFWHRITGRSRVRKGLRLACFLTRRPYRETHIIGGERHVIVR